jgi:para-aminobenzoate synthetase/4-amino-4-deoxychorismate lyase
MEIIANLETTPREVYCGAIGYITPKKEAIFYCSDQNSCD